MSQVRAFHDKAMELAQLALVARQQGERQRAEDCARQAYQLEAQAADLIPDDKSSEPTRSILYRSAASLAYQCRELDIAQRLIAKGLSGYPPPQIEHELKDLYEQLNFEYHLQTRDVVLEDEDLQLSMLGKAVGSGLILYGEFTKRVNATFSLIDRTVQRMMGKEYQGRGRVAQVYKPFIPALSAPREGSFAITLRLVRPDIEQLSFMYSAAEVIDEIISGIELINNADEAGLQKMIREEAYYQHFIASTQTIAPDGDRINFVGFASRGRRIGLTRQRSNIELVPSSEDTADDVNKMTPTKVEGLLDYAMMRKENIIRLTSEKGDNYKIVVREGMEDLVKSYFGEWVVVTGLTTDGKTIRLTSIQSSDE